MNNKTTFWQQLYEQSQEVDLERMPVEHMQLNHNLAQPASVDASKAGWLPSPAKGVKRLMLEREGGEKTIRATSIVAYAANSQFAAHEHPKGEEFFVLAGVFSDERGDYPAGTYVRNPPGSSHQPFSREGCLILVKLQQFAAYDTQNIVIDVLQKTADVSDDTLCRKVLFDGYERVEMVYISQTCVLPEHWQEKGIEILLLSGELGYGENSYLQGHWLRLPPDSKGPLTAQKNSKLLIKYGHLESGL
jgi:anti-sigma factor ChrR (cupin superfamily)